MNAEAQGADGACARLWTPLCEIGDPGCEVIEECNVAVCLGLDCEKGGNVVYAAAQLE